MADIDESERELREHLTAILRSKPPLMRVLSVARNLCLPDWLVFSGAVCQPVLNQLTGRLLDYGIKDYDLAYFDASDLSYEAEDAVIRRRPLWASRCGVWSRFATKLACMSGSRRNSASRTRRCRARLRHWNTSPRQHPQSAFGWSVTTGFTSKLPSVLPIYSRCDCGPILAERRSVSPVPPRMCDAAGLKS
jgi:hypothetical protein